MALTLAWSAAATPLLSLKQPSLSFRCTANPNNNNNKNKNKVALRTCKNCKTQFDPALNHLRACRFHTAHFGGETKRKFESVYTGGTMSTPNSGEVLQYWHCCGSEDPFDPGCTAAPHSSSIHVFNNAGFNNHPDHRHIELYSPHQQQRRHNENAF